MADEKETKAPAKKAAAKKAAAGKEPEATPTEETTVEDGGAQSKDSEVVEVSRNDLQQFMKRLSDLEADNKRLLEASDKARMAAISERERGDSKKLPEVKITRIGKDGKLVLAWQLTKNESYVDGNRLVEHQEMEVFYQDGKSEAMPLLSFYRQQNKDTKGQIISRTVQSEGGEMLKVRLAGGEEIDIDLKFVN